PGTGLGALAASVHGKRAGVCWLGGLTFQSSGRSSPLALREPGHTGAEASYLKQPGGGSFTLSANGMEVGSVSTVGPEHTAGFAHFRLPGAGARTVEIQAHGAVRLFGIILEKP